MFGCNKPTLLDCPIIKIKAEKTLDSKVDPFRVILEFQLAWVVDFCIRSKKWKIQFFLET